MECHGAGRIGCRRPVPRAGTRSIVTSPR
jgi:hypothetical protein